MCVVIIIIHILETKVYTESTSHLANHVSCSQQKHNLPLNRNSVRIILLSEGLIFPHNELMVAGSRTELNGPLMDHLTTRRSAYLEQLPFSTTPLSSPRAFALRY